MSATTTPAQARGEIVRVWSTHRVMVSTVHPQFGELHRGIIWPCAHDGARTVWAMQDADWHYLDPATGDYLDAEAQLLEATGWADELDPNHHQPDEE